MNSHGTNRLIHEKSPYLLQHARNPVEWFPWCDEAFEEARRRDVPVFLSIGYSTCHWCHVMERESFENPEIASLLNGGFVAIKVDREELPDVDRIYMQALQALGQRGGWPLTMFLTPDREPFTGGTYFPPVRRGGMPGLPEVLHAIRSYWEGRREEVTDAAKSVTRVLRESALPVEKDSFPDPEMIFDAADRTLFEIYDEKEGGFAHNLPNKFPPFLQLLYLLERHRVTGSEETLRMATETLRAIRKGGIFDHVGGGLSRYATDPSWRVPHFEKMLYDNALFLWTLCEAKEATDDQSFAEAARSVADYLMRDLRSPEGGFYCAEDADSEGEEGLFYLWSREEFRTTATESGGLTPEEAEAMEKHFGITEAGNFEEGRNILYEAKSLETCAAETRLDLPKLRESREAALQALFLKRSKRIRPHRDEKILLSWNALTLLSLTVASRILGDDSLHNEAVLTARFLLTKLRDGEGNLKRRYCEGESAHRAGLADYALLGLACTELYATDFDEGWPGEALGLAREIRDRFSPPEPGLFYDSDASSQDLLMRSSETHDGVEPSGNASAYALFRRLSALGFHDLPYEEMAAGIEEGMAPSLLKGNGPFHAFFLREFHRRYKDGRELAVITGEERWQEDLRIIRKALGQGLPVAVGDGENEGPFTPPLLHHRSRDRKGQTLYLCEGGSCRYPLHNAGELLESLKN